MKVTFNTQSTNLYYSAPNFRGIPKSVLKSNPVQDTFTKQAAKKAGFLAGTLGAIKAFFTYRETEEQAANDMYIHQQTSRGYNGEIFMHHADLDSMKKVHENLKDKPKVLRKIHFTKNYAGKIPMHYAKDEQVAEIGRAFKDRPDILKKIYLTKNKKGKTPLFYATPSMIDNIFETFGKDPKTLKKILLVKNKRGKYPIHDMHDREMNMLNIRLLDYPDIMVKLLSPSSINKFGSKITSDFDNETHDILAFGIDMLLSKNNLSLRQYNLLRKSDEMLWEKK